MKNIKKKIIFVLMFVLPCFCSFQTVFAYGIKLKDSGGNPGIDNDHGIVAWTVNEGDNISKSGDTLFCLDEGEAMSASWELSVSSAQGDAPMFQCSVYKVFNNLSDKYSLLNKNGVKFATFVSRLNNGGSYKSLFKNVQLEIWNKKNDCTTTDIYEPTTTYAYSLKISNNGIRISGQYYITEITISSSNVDSYKVDLSDLPLGSSISASETGTNLSLDSRTEKKLFVRIPKNNIGNDTSFSIRLYEAKHKKSSGKKYNPVVTIYKLDKTQGQRLGKVSYTEKDFTDYGYDGVSNKLNLTLDVCDAQLNVILNNNDVLEQKKQLISLYQSEKIKGNDFKSLLNFNSPSCNPSSCDYTNSTTCLNGENGTTSFGPDNLSCYNETITVDGVTGYCLTTFNFENKLGTTSFLSKAGQLFIKSNSFNNGLIGKGSLNKTCYVYGTTTSSSVSSGVYKDYVTSISFNNQTLNSGSLNTSLTLIKTGNVFSGVVNADYALPSVYALNGTGKLTDSSCKSTGGSPCKFLGYGFISKLSDNNSGNIDFKVSFNNTLNNSLIDGTGTCPYTTIPELIKNNKLQLEFRTVDTSNPFLEKSGNLSRKVGSNWCKDDDCSATNCLVNNVMSSRNDSNNKKNSEPLYKIVLDSSDITKIRKYNKQTTYDDYNMICDENGENCKSKFIQNLSNDQIVYNDETTESIDSLEFYYNEKDNEQIPEWLDGYDEGLCEVTEEEEEEEKTYICQTVRGDGTGVGDEISCSGENFYVIENDGANIIMLAKYNLKLSERPTQDSTRALNGLAFSSNVYWASGGYRPAGNSPYPYVYDSNSQVYGYVQKYKAVLQGKGINVLGAKLMSFEQLNDLGCSDISCRSASSWVYSTTYWLGSARGSVSGYNGVWRVDTSGYVSPPLANGGFVCNGGIGDKCGTGLRPLIIISVDELG